MYFHNDDDNMILCMYVYVYDIIFYGIILGEEYA
jgi:hypothetical protein